MYIKTFLICFVQNVPNTNLAELSLQPSKEGQSHPTIQETIKETLIISNNEENIISSSFPS